MRYRNKKTGIEFETNCIISGADFEEVIPKKAPETEVKDEKPKTTSKRTKK